MSKNIWITGASSGIGKAVAEKFANEGWKVAISARRKEILDQISNNKNIYSFPLDVTNENNCKTTFAPIKPRPPVTKTLILFHEKDLIHHCP